MSGEITSLEIADLDREACYRALQTRDARFDGRFYTAVRSTGIFCRPICPARTPLLKNCIFLPTAAAAHQMGFRPCLRCRPETAPGVAAWRGVANTVARALHLIAEGALDDAGVDALAERLGVGGRHLRRLFDRYVGASPVSVAQAHRLLFAKQLISDTRLPMTEVALAAGFGSVRRFNDAFRDSYGRAPSALRKGSAPEVSAADRLVLKLAYSSPYDWSAIMDFLAYRAIPGVEAVVDGVYRRSFAIGGARGTLEARPLPAENSLQLSVRTNDISVLAAIVARVRRLFDLDADIAAIDGHLAADPALAAWVAARPGVRVPGAWDGFELAVRALLGQQVSVPAARTFAGRLAAATGEALPNDLQDGNLNLIFPTPAAVAASDPTAIGLTRARAAALTGLSAAMAADPKLLRAYETLEETLAKLQALPGVGAWTAQYIAMRALREPDAFPASDLGLLRAMAGPDGVRPTPQALEQQAEAWRPWRAYGALRLWLQGDQNPAKAAKAA